jgi:heat-inducible transcriptional repressor
MDATERSKRILAALVRQYIASGEPVASSLLVSVAGLGVSSATVRSTLARLEAEGYVQQPHPSAGRVPTDRGYRFYVDLLLDQRRTRGAAARLEAQLRRDRATALDAMLPQVSHLRSRVSRGLGFAVRPRSDAAVFDRVEFVPLSSDRVLVVIIAQGGHVVQKAVDTPEPWTADDLRQAANYLNAEFAGLPLARARAAIVERLREERLLYNELLARAMRLASSTFDGIADERGLWVEGAAALLEADANLTLGTLQALVQMIEEKQKLVRLLSGYIDGPGLTIVIGAEHADPSLRPLSLIVSTYEDGAGWGTVGVIGPTRMRYSRAIAVVDGAAQAVSRVLRGEN